MLGRCCIVAVAAYAVIFLLQVRCAPSRPSREDVSATSAADPEAVADIKTSGSGQLVPRTPAPWQKKPAGKPPRCGPKEKELYGACYRRAHPDDYSPPCEAPTYEHDGVCYFATNVPKVPTSLTK